MRPPQISTSVSPETRKQANELIERFGYSLRDVLTIAIEKLYTEKTQEVTMKPRKGDHVKIDGKYHGTVVQDGVSKSLVSTKRSDGEPGWEQNWYNNSRLCIVTRN